LSPVAVQRYLGLDPGYGRLGYAVVEQRGAQWVLVDVGCVETLASLAFEERLVLVHTALDEILERWKPQEASIETLYFSRNVKTAMQVAEARGVLRLTLAMAGVPAFEIAPNAVKLALTGSGAATKDQVGRMVVRLLGLKEMPKPDDAADAVALALAGLRSRPMRQQVAAAKASKPKPASKGKRP
jgi:crossover junction endodeoxyribonuclease RuvC